MPNTDSKKEDKVSPPAEKSSMSQPSSSQAVKKTNTLAIVALVLSILLFVAFPLLGIILGVIALSQIKKSGENGKGLAIASIVISSIGLVVSILSLIFFFVFLSQFQKTAKDYGIDTKTGSIEYKKDGDSYSIGSAKLPDGFPSDVPIYPGSKITSAIKNKDTKFIVTLTTNDSKDKVESYYNDELSAEGWSSGNESSFDLGALNNKEYTKSGSKLNVTIVSSNDNRTLVTLSVEN